MTNGDARDGLTQIILCSGSFGNGDGSYGAMLRMRISVPNFELINWAVCSASANLFRTPHKPSSYPPIHSIPDINVTKADVVHPSAYPAQLVLPATWILSIVIDRSSTARSRRPNGPISIDVT
eukprot:1486173-Rhodomonas_salina.4